jgi:hypothetical protein
MHDGNIDVIDQFRGNNGVITSGMFKGARLLYSPPRGQEWSAARQPAGVHT